MDAICRCGLPTKSPKYKLSRPFGKRGRKTFQNRRENTRNKRKEREKKILKHKKLTSRDKKKTSRSHNRRKKNESTRNRRKHKKRDKSAKLNEKRKTDRKRKNFEFIVPKPNKFNSDYPSVVTILVTETRRISKKIPNAKTNKAIGKSFPIKRKGYSRSKSWRKNENEAATKSHLKRENKESVDEKTNHLQQIFFWQNAMSIEQGKRKERRSKRTDDCKNSREMAIGNSRKKREVFGNERVSSKAMRNSKKVKQIRKWRSIRPSLKIFRGRFKGEATSDKTNKENTLNAQAKSEDRGKRKSIVNKTKDPQARRGDRGKKKSIENKTKDPQAKSRDRGKKKSIENIKRDPQVKRGDRGKKKSIEDKTKDPQAKNGDRGMKNSVENKTKDPQVKRRDKGKKKSIENKTMDPQAKRGDRGKKNSIENKTKDPQVKRRDKGKKKSIENKKKDPLAKRGDKGKKNSIEDNTKDPQANRRDRGKKKSIEDKTKDPQAKRRGRGKKKSIENKKKDPQAKRGDRGKKKSIEDKTGHKKTRKGKKHQKQDGNEDDIPRSRKKEKRKQGKKIHRIHKTCSGVLVGKSKVLTSTDCCNICVTIWESMLDERKEPSSPNSVIRENFSRMRRKKTKSLLKSIKVLIGFSKVNQKIETEGASLRVKNISISQECYLKKINESGK
ncbi:hypothetical protein SK128_002227 [Halocaridina rubra]|uniref:Uncharacterized protein n=1 Tax=Halocaridina rubra TaxID=373956 RepID=A0AAN8X2Z9_HALRR